MARFDAWWSPLVAVLFRGVAGLTVSAIMALRFGNAANAAPPRAEQVGFIMGVLAATNALLGGILGVLLFQAMR